MDNSDASGPYDVDREAQRLRLRSEQLAATTETVSAGEARLRTSVESVTRSLQIPCVRESASIERRGVNHGAAAPIDGDRRIVVRLSGERPVVVKETIVTEEVAFGLRRVASTRRITEAVRHEEVRVAYDGAGDEAR